VHLHFHGITAQDVSAILNRVNRDHGRRELGADRIPPKPGPALLDAQRRRTGR
jgi:hypothetical protein